MKFSNFSFKTQFYVTMLSVVFLIMFAGFSFNILSSYEYRKESFIKESKLRATLIADSALAPLMFANKDGIASILLQLKTYKNILQVVIYDNEKQIFARYNPHYRDIPVYIDKEDDWFLDLHTDFVVKQHILVNGIKYGTIYLENDTKNLKEFITNSILNIFLFSIVLLIIMVFLIAKLSNKLLSPIINLSQRLTKLSESQNYDTRLAYESDNEIGKLYGAFNNLFISISIHQKSRDQALAKAKSYQQHLESLRDELEKRVKDRTRELQNSISTLKKAQKQLIESEKMAALGSLVSGVAHEVNTPLGNAVTGSSIIKSECHLLLEMVNTATLKKSTLQSKLEHIEETSKLLFRSITNAADLIKSFKKISVDQSVEPKREFDLNEYIHEVVFTFHNKLKQIPVEVEIIPNEVLNIKSYPGSYAQLLNNFIQNSIIHGFENYKGDAKIKIEVFIKEDFIYLIYSDNGNGMSKYIKEKAFEPFITTKRNAGGTGLGLNIVYNLIVQKLNGSLNLETSKGNGTKFSIKIPL